MPGLRRSRRRQPPVDYSGMFDSESDEEEEVAVPRRRSSRLRSRARAVVAARPDSDSEDSDSDNSADGNPHRVHAAFVSNRDLQRHAEAIMRGIMGSKNLLYTPEKKVKDLFALRVGPYHVEFKTTPSCLNTFRSNRTYNCVADRPEATCDGMHYKAIAYFTGVVANMHLDGRQKMDHLFGPKGCFRWSVRGARDTRDRVPGGKWRTFRPTAAQKKELDQTDRILSLMQDGERAHAERQRKVQKDKYLQMRAKRTGKTLKQVRAAYAKERQQLEQELAATMGVRGGAAPRRNKRKSSKRKKKK